jgi:hypothetical protein
MQEQIRLQRFVYILAVIKILIPYVLQNGIYEPHRDELLYLAEGKHPAWGFMEVPPVLSVFAWLTHVFGDGIFWIKLWPSLFGAGTFILCGDLIIRLGGRTLAVVLCFFAFIFGAYLRVFFLFQPNPPEIFFWTFTAFCIVRFIQTGRDKWLYLFGIGAGLGLMSKYSIALFLFSVLGGLLLTKERTLLKRKAFWLGSLAGFAIFLPNFAWQASHHFPVVHHMQELQRTQLQYVSPVSFMIDQLIMNIPCFFIWIAGLLGIAFSRSLRPFRFLAIAYVIVIVLLLVTHGKNYYSLGVYPLLFAFGAVQLEQWTRKKSLVLRWAFIVVPIVLGLLAIPVALPIMAPQQLAALYVKMKVKKTGVLKWEDQKDHPLPQDFSDMLGWREMSVKMAAAYKRLSPAERDSVVLFCDNYGIAGAISLYGNKDGLPPPYSANASFLYWLPQNFHPRNLLLLTDDPHEMEHDFIRNFTSAVVMDSITAPFARERGDLIIYLKGANEKFDAMLQEKIRLAKAGVE